jgi:hypothetical protein
MNQERMEAWWSRLQDVEYQEGLDTKEREDLSNLLQHGIMVKALGLLLHRVPKYAASLLSIDLSSEDGVKQAIRNQSQAAGITRSVEMLGEMALETKERERGEG